MADRLAELPRIALANHNLRVFDLRAEYNWSESVVNNLRALSRAKTSNILFAGIATFTIKAVKYAIRASVRAIERDQTIVVTIEYLRWPGAVGRRTANDRAREAGLVAALLDLGKPNDCLYSFLFQYSLDTVEEMWFPLPTKVGDTSEGGYEIEGVAVAKLSTSASDEPEYRFFLSAVGSNVSLNVFLPSSDLVESSSIRSAVNTSKRHASALVSIKN